MDIREERIITICTTPKALRDLATKIEIVFPEKTIGDSTVCAVWYGENNLKIQFSADQDSFEKHRTGNKSSWI